MSVSWGDGICLANRDQWGQACLDYFVAVDHGFRLSSATDNRPLKWEKFLKRIGQTVYLSATRDSYEFSRAKRDAVDQIIRPTGLVGRKNVGKPC